MVRAALILSLALMAYGPKAHAQDAPPIPSGTYCTVDPVYTTEAGCELGNVDLVLGGPFGLASYGYSSRPCYSNMVGQTIGRHWTYSPYSHVGDSTYAYQVGLYIIGTNSSDPHGSPPCTYVLPTASDPWSYLAMANQSITTDYEYIMVAQSLTCPPTSVGGGVVTGTADFVCPCPNKTAWNGDPWGDSPIPGFTPSCAVPPITQDGADVPFTLSCSGGSCGTDHRATFFAANSYPIINVTYPAGGYVDAANSYVTSGCCTKIPVTWQVVKRTFYPATGVRATVPTSAGAVVQAHLAIRTSKSTQNSATYYVSANTCSTCN